MKRPASRPKLRIPPSSPGFSLLEILVSVAVLALVTILTFSIVSGVSTAWQQQKARVSAYEKARIGFELLGQRLAQATLNTYWDYDDPGRPRRYTRQSELHFTMGRATGLGVPDAITDAVFFLAPLGFTQNTTLHPLVKMLTGAGFFVRFSDDPARPEFLDARFPPRWRFRLFQMIEPGEELSVYVKDAPANEWFLGALGDNSYPMIDNVIGLILRARYPVGNSWRESFDYDSRVADLSSPWSHQLPPSVAVTMVVIDEDSARRLEVAHGASPPPVQPPEGAFADTGRYFQDLEDWETKLQALRPPVAYQIFEADIPIRAAKWSMDAQ